MNIYQDIPRLYTAIAEWLGCMILIYLIGFRFGRTQTVSISAGFLLLQGAFLYFTGNLSLLLWLPCMIGAVGLMYLMIILLGKVSFLQAGYLLSLIHI